MGYALYLAQMGERHVTMTKTLRGFGGASVIELKERQAGNAYRAVYTVRYAEAIYVLHAFQKKSNQGIATPKAEMDLVEQRLKELVTEKERTGRRREDDEKMPAVGTDAERMAATRIPPMRKSIS